MSVASSAARKGHRMRAFTMHAQRVHLYGDDAATDGAVDHARQQSASQPRGGTKAGSNERAS